MRKAFLSVLLAAFALFFVAPAFAQTATPLPQAAKVGQWLDLGAGPLILDVVLGGVSVYAADDDCSDPDDAVQMPQRSVDRNAPFYTTYHVCAAALNGSAIILTLPYPGAGPSPPGPYVPTFYIIGF
jgi:hypothetical protein